MTPALQISCDVPQADVAAFVDALSRWSKETHRDMRAAVRSATIDLIRSLRARTRKSKKFIDRLEISKSYLSPKWIKRGHSGKPLRRMQLMRWSKGTNWLDHRYVYGGEYAVGPKGGQTISPFSEAHMRKEAQKNYGRIRNWGLAKKSWGWFMKSLFHQSMQDDNPKAVIKPGMVDREMREREATDTTPGEYEITLINRLEYMRKGVPQGVFSIAIQKATNLINAKINKGFASRRFGV